MHVPFVDLNRETKTLEKELLDALRSVIEGGNFILGPEVRCFEEEFSAFCGTGEGIGVASGTDALTLSLKALELGPGDEVLTAANTFIATFDAITRCGATPVPVDVDPDYYTVDVGAMEAAITDRTAAVVPVHLYGQPAEMDEINGLASQRGLPVIEDAAQAHGALYKGRRAGSLGRCGCFSFYPSKNLGAFGDGGMVVTGDRAIAARLKELRNYGQESKNVHLEVGFNSRLDEIQAAILRINLKRLEENNRLRREAARRYRERLGRTDGVVLPKEREGDFSHVYHLFVIRCSERDGLREHLAGRDVSTGLHYPTPTHLQPAYHHLGYRKGSFPVTEKISAEILSLPIFPHIREDEIDYVCESIRGFLVV